MGHSRTNKPQQIPNANKTPFPSNFSTHNSFSHPLEKLHFTGRTKQTKIIDNAKYTIENKKH